MKFSLRAARNFSRRREFGAAVANYLGVFKFFPANAATFEADFLQCLNEFCGQLEKSGKVDAANEYYTLAFEFFASSPRFMNSWGQFLIRHALYEEAALCFIKSLDLMPNGRATGDEVSSAKRSLWTLRNCLVDRWHFRMLNDRQRNGAYEQALSLCVARCRSASPTVLDIGCGTGLLSMLAVEAGASRVYACEHSPIMCQIARKAVVDNGFVEQIELLEKNSKDVDALDAPVDIVVTELMDAGFFGEGLVPSLLDAKRRLLSVDGGVVLPSKAKIWACLIECPAIRSSNAMLMADGDRKMVFCSNVCADVNGMSASGASAIFKGAEPYTSIMLNKVKGGFRYASQAILVDEIDLNDERDLQKHEDGFQRRFEMELIENAHGAPLKADAVACWFEAELLPGITVFTKPENGTSWEQAVFPFAVRGLRENEDRPMVLEFEIRSNWMQCSVISKDETANAKLDFFVVNDSTLIERMNDQVLTDFYLRFAKEMTEITGTILDFCDDPILTSKLARQFPNRLLTVADGETAAAINALSNTEKIHILKSTDDDRRSKEVKLTPTVLLYCPVDSCGLLKQGIFENVAVARLRYNVAHLCPAVVELVGMLVESEELEQYGRVVSDRHTLGLKIRSSINVFETDVHQDLHLSTLQHRKLCRPKTLMTLDLREPLWSDENSTDVVPKFLRQNVDNDLRIEENGTAHALIFWFEFSTEFGERMSTNDERTHFRVSAALTKKAFSTTVGDSVNVTTTLERGELYFDVVLDNLLDKPL